MLAPLSEIGFPALEQSLGALQRVLETLPPAWEISREARRVDASALAGATVPDQPVPPPEAIPRLIDHTLLRGDATPAEVERLCTEACEYGFAAVCVNPRFVPLAASLLRKTRVRVCAVVGFPLGASTSIVKIGEAEVAIEEGARELDMVPAVGALKSGALSGAGLDVAAVVAVAHARQAVVKVILDSGVLSAEEQVRACLLARDAGADFVKTSTEFHPRSAEESDIRRLRALVGPGMGVEAAGGIGTRADLERMVRAGASRIGTSNGMEILHEYLEISRLHDVSQIRLRPDDRPRLGEG
jgi:deoxyribose-phosphate aldolase